jgi:hypothetical protein
MNHIVLIRAMAQLELPAPYSRPELLYAWGSLPASLDSGAEQTAYNDAWLRSACGSCWGITLHQLRRLTAAQPMLRWGWLAWCASL